MKKLFAVLIVLAIVFAFAGCSSKQYVDTVVTIPVTDENGKEVTDKNGDVVTEVSSEAPSKTEDKTSKKDNKDTTKTEKEDKTSKKSKDKTTEKSTKAKDKTTEKTSKNTTETSTKKETTEKQTTTEKPKNRDIDLSVKIPYYNSKDTKITVKYKAKGDKKYTKLITEDITLDKEQIKSYEIKKVKGDVKIIVTLEGIDASHNTATVKSNENSASITIVTGIEAIDGGMD